MSFDLINKNGVVLMTSPNINTTHAFTTRLGGVSTGIYKSMNLAQKSEDNFDNVKANYSQLCNALGISPDDIVCGTQVHGTFIRAATNNDRGQLFKPNPHQADGIITKTPGLALMIFTADCVPILLYDPVKKVAAAVHAGWRSTVADITGIAVNKMVTEFGSSPADINAAIGPCISKCCFETDSDVVKAIADTLGESSQSCYSQKNNKYMVDLKETNRLLLSRVGIKNISISDECTFCSFDKYWSHRKTNGKRGSQAAIIIIDN